MSNQQIICEPLGFGSRIWKGVKHLIGFLFCLVIVVVVVMAVVNYGFGIAYAGPIIEFGFFIGIILDIVMSVIFLGVVGMVFGFLLMAIEQFSKAFSKKIDRIFIDNKGIKFINRRDNSVKEYKWDQMKKIDNKNDPKSETGEEDVTKKNDSKINLYVGDEIVTFYLEDYLTGHFYDFLL